MGEYMHESPLLQHGVIAYYEAIDEIGQSSYTIGEAPHEFEVARLDVNDVSPKLGVGLVTWSPDTRYMATRCDAMPRVLWIWETLRLSLCSVIVQDAPILSVMWDPTQARLALCTGNGKVYFWSPNGCSCVDVPSPEMNVRKVTWSPHGEYLLMNDRRAFSVCYAHAVEF